MKNKEKFADILMDLLVKNKRVAISNKTGEPCSCSGFRCDNCLFGTVRCDEEATRKWLEEEYEPKVDWSEVPVDTKVYVRDRKEDEWIPRYFSEFKNGIVYVWPNGTTSFTSGGYFFVFEKIRYKYAKLAEEEKNETD